MAPFGIAVHGGAGTLTPQSLPPERERVYRAKLAEAVQAGHAILKRGGRGVDAVEAALRVLEDCEEFNAGRGSVYTHDGRHEMDAAIMDGRGRRAGGVLGVQLVKNPITLARRVLERSPHVLLAGAGAEEFAREHGVDFAPPAYFATARRWRAVQSARLRDGLPELPTPVHFQGRAPGSAYLSAHTLSDAERHAAADPERARDSDAAWRAEVLHVRSPRASVSIPYPKGGVGSVTPAPTPLVLPAYIAEAGAVGGGRGDEGEGTDDDAPPSAPTNSLLVEALGRQESAFGTARPQPAAGIPALTITTTDAAPLAGTAVRSPPPPPAQAAERHPHVEHESAASQSHGVDALTSLSNSSVGGMRTPCEAAAVSVAAEVAAMAAPQADDGHDVSAVAAPTTTQADTLRHELDAHSAAVHRELRDLREGKAASEAQHARELAALREELAALRTLLQTRGPGTGTTTPQVQLEADTAALEGSVQTTLPPLLPPSPPPADDAAAPGGVRHAAPPPLASRPVNIDHHGVAAAAAADFMCRTEPPPPPPPRAVPAGMGGVQHPAGVGPAPVLVHTHAAPPAPPPPQHRALQSDGVGVDVAGQWGSPPPGTTDMTAAQPARAAQTPPRGGGTASALAGVPWPTYFNRAPGGGGEAVGESSTAQRQHADPRTLAAAAGTPAPGDNAADAAIAPPPRRVPCYLNPGTIAHLFQQSLRNERQRRDVPVSPSTHLRPTDDAHALATKAAGDIVDAWYGRPGAGDPVRRASSRSASYPQMRAAQVAEAGVAFRPPPPAHTDAPEAEAVWRDLRAAAARSVSPPRPQRGAGARHGQHARAAPLGGPVVGAVERREHVGGVGSDTAPLAEGGVGAPPCDAGQRAGVPRRAAGSTAPSAERPAAETRGRPAQRRESYTSELQDKRAASARSLKSTASSLPSHPTRWRGSDTHIKPQPYEASILSGRGRDIRDTDAVSTTSMSPRQERARSVDTTASAATRLSVQERYSVGLAYLRRGRSADKSPATRTVCPPPAMPPTPPSEAHEVIVVSPPEVGVVSPPPLPPFDDGPGGPRAMSAHADADDGKRWGTVGCVVLDQHGHVAAGTSTGGATNKKYGRVGDTALFGSGTYADNATCAVSATGSGEAFVRCVTGHDIAALMEYKGMALRAAVCEVLHNKVSQIEGEGGVIAIDTKGNIAMEVNAPGMLRASMDADGRLEVGIFNPRPRSSSAVPQPQGGALRRARSTLEERKRSFNLTSLPEAVVQTARYQSTAGIR